MSRIAAVQDDQAGALAQIAFRMCRAMYGKVLGPLGVVAHHAWLMLGYANFEFMLQRAHRVEPKLKCLASVKASAMIGCPF